MKRMSLICLAIALLATGCIFGSNNVFDLEVGQCFNDPGDNEEVANVEIVDCTESHDNEVFHLFDVPGDEWPGDEAISASADEGCFNAFEGYVGTDYLSSEFFYAALRPTEQTWDGNDDREVVCFLRLVDGTPRTGSARNSGI